MTTEKPEQPQPVDHMQRNTDEWLQFIEKSLRVVFACVVLYAAYLAIPPVWQWLNKPPAPPPPPPSPASIAKEREFQNVRLRLLALKQSAKNPDSFQLVSAHLTSDDVLCVSFRGTNSYNAVVTQRYAMAADGSQVKWSKSCDTMPSKDYSHALSAG